MIDNSQDLSFRKYDSAQTLMKKYIHLFTCGSEDLEEGNMPAYSMLVKNYEPMAMPPYSLSLVERAELDQQVDQLKIARLWEILKVLLQRWLSF